MRFADLVGVGLDLLKLEAKVVGSGRPQGCRALSLRTAEIRAWWVWKVGEDAVEMADEEGVPDE